ncbi:hypothetical protein [Streptomyces acidiscabies]|nr:hypothetical protein [Streptomyces acidiscabies]
MPGIVAERRVGQVTAEAGAVVDVSGLTGAERTVALYASDMPNGRRRHTKDEIRAWIVQGVGRLGTAETRRRAKFFRGHLLLRLNGLVTTQIQARHEQSFPLPKRLRKAETEAAGSVWVDGMNAATVTRNGRAAVDGECPCRGTGEIGVDGWGGDAASCTLLCPVHRQAEIAAHHRRHRTGR